MTVMTMTATDYDDPNEGTNARLKYSIEQNQVNENGELIFTIDEETGVISTAVCCLDRETNPEYTIKVVAMDGGGLKGNKNIPYFFSYYFFPFKYLLFRKKINFVYFYFFSEYHSNNMCTFTYIVNSHDN